jgi:hypothetical protein
MSVITNPPALLAGPGKVTGLRIRKGHAIGQFVNTHPGDAVQFIGFILLERNIVFRHA